MLLIGQHPLNTGNEYSTEEERDKPVDTTDKDGWMEPDRYPEAGGG